MQIIIRKAHRSDTEQLLMVINPIIAKGGTTAHKDPFSVDALLKRYVAPASGICTFAAFNGDQALGFQSLKWMQNAPEADVKWATIATFVGLNGQSQGVGKKLFAQTLGAAYAAGVEKIDATIRKENSGGLAFYTGLGFVDYFEDDERHFKVLTL